LQYLKYKVSIHTASHVAVWLWLGLGLASQASRVYTTWCAIHTASRVYI